MRLGDFEDGNFYSVGNVGRSQLIYFGLINTPVLIFGNQCQFLLLVYNGTPCQKVLETQ